VRGQVKNEAPGRGLKGCPGVFIIADYSGESVDLFVVYETSRLNDYLVRHRHDDRPDDASSCPLGALLHSQTW
jgi:hypothetical protein